MVVDESSVNHHLASKLKERINVETTVQRMKAEKSEVEMEGMKACNIRDCAAIFKYFGWLR